MMYDTLIIGAGAAGLAAGRLLHDAGQKVAILEARDRIGGRIWTDTSGEFPLELGAEFIHGETAATHELVKAAGLSTIPVDRKGKLRWSSRKVALRPDEWPESLRTVIDGLRADYAALPEHLGQTDMSLKDYLQGRGWDYHAIEIADVLLAQTCCVDIEDLSCADLVREMQVDHAGDQEFRIREGYTALFTHYSRDLDIRLNTPVSHIAWEQSPVKVTTGDQIFTAKHVIITLPVSLLKTNAITFEPPLSTEKRRAIDAFRMESATKLIFQFSEPIWDADLTYMAHNERTARWWTPGYGRDGSAIISSYITSRRAWHTDQHSDEDCIASGLYDLSKMLGKPMTVVYNAFKSLKRVSWGNDPYTRGGYAAVPPGFADIRPTLARPEGNTLFFAGEATAYDTNPQTVHGALESGWRAAKECLAI